MHVFSAVFFIGLTLELSGGGAVRLNEMLDLWWEGSPMLSLSLSKPGKYCEEAADGNKTYTQGRLGKRKNAAEYHQDA